jgi:hypothetical protein
LRKTGNKKACFKGWPAVLPALGIRVILVLTILLVSMVAALPALADIYKYIDNNGVLHFTNTPTDSGFVLYMKERRDSVRPSGDVPVAYEGIIQKAGKTYGLDTALIKAVIQAESNFNPRAVSGKGARGLMQIMPENDQALNISNAFNPSQNIMGGAYYLKKLLIRYDNRLTLALAAYNAGPTAVDRYGRIPPYGETQAYVRKVMGLYNRFKRI